MNASAAMRRRVVRGAGVLFLVFVAVVWGWVNTHLTSLPRRELSSVHLADPVEMMLDGETIHVSRFVLHPANHSLMLEQDELTFNDYGDATRVGGKQPLQLAERYAREPFNDSFVVTASEQLSPRPVFALEKNAMNTARLFVAHRILDLRGSEGIPDEIGDRPQGDSFSFRSLIRRDARLYGIGVSGSLLAGGILGIDPNVHGSGTLLVRLPAEVTFKPLGPDPLERGRRAFEVLPKEIPEPENRERRLGKLGVQPGEWILVLGPTELSEHRLVFKEDGAVRQVLRLENLERGGHGP
jgi:hypothetical protein